MLRLGLAITAFFVIADQATKWWAREALAETPGGIEVTGFFNLVLVWNRGVSFGMLGGGAVPPWLLVLLTGAVTVALIVWLTRVDEPWLGVALGFVIAGAIGNIVDRLVFGAVTDFLDIHLGGVHFPAFNVADSAVTVGVAILLIDSLLIRKEKHKKEGKE